MFKRLKYSSLDIPHVECFNFGIYPEVKSFFLFFTKLFKKLTKFSGKKFCINPTKPVLQSSTSESYFSVFQFLTFFSTLFKNRSLSCLVFQRLAVIIVILFSTTTIGWGQNTGDYQSAQSGNWNQIATWQRYNGSSWETPTTGQGTPTNASNNITIRDSHTVTVTANVTVDQVVVEAGGQVNLTSNVTLTIANGAEDDFVVYGTVYRTNGTITTTGTLVFGDGGTYQHARNGNSVPTATWDANSNCNITGITNTSPGGLIQTFGNFTWDCIGQGTNNLDVFFNSPTTIKGNFSVISTGTTGSIRLTQNTARTLNINGDLNIIGGTLNLSRGNRIETINLSGNFIHTSGTITETGSASGIIFFNGSSMQTYTSGGNVSNNINFTVLNNAYLQLEDVNTEVSGNSFTLSSGATLGITSADGITSSGTTGNIRTSNRSFSTEANYIYNGTSAQNTGNGLPATVSNLTFDNTGGAITFNSERNITDNFTITSGSVANLGTFTHAAGDLTLAGDGTVSGSWGSSSSSATNQNDTYFASTTGIINVANSKCGVVSAPTGISASPAEICSGSSTTLSVNIPGSGFTTDWFTGSCGGTLVGTGNSLVVSPSATTTYYARTRNTTTNCVSGGCANVTVVVNEPLPVSVNIVSTPSGVVCEGTVVTFTATATNGGSNPSFQWKVNGTNVGSNSNIYSYEPKNGDKVTCILTSDLQCVTGIGNVPVTYFSWDDAAKAVTDSDFGPDAISIGGGQYLTGGVSGTTALAPITVPKTDINLNLGNNPVYDTDGVDYSISYRRAEAVAQLFTRGNSLIISGGSAFNVSYRIDDGAGSFTTVTSTNFAIADDSNFHNYRFTYNPSDGFGRLFIDGTEVWTSTATPGKAIYWTGAGDLIIGANTDASGNLIPTFDNLSINGLTPKIAFDEVTLSVYPLPEITVQPQPLTRCQGDDGSFTATTSANSPTYQWQYSNNATGPWTNTNGVTNVSGHTTNTLSFINLPVLYSNNYVSCVITSNGCSVRTNAALLIVNPLPATGEIIPD